MSRIGDLLLRFLNKGNGFETNLSLNSKFLEFSKEALSIIFQSLGTEEEGLIDEEAKRRLAIFGTNEVSHEKPPTWYLLLLKNFTNPFNILLIFLATISYFIGETDAVVIISIMVALSILIRFSQELRSNKAAQKLQAMVSTKATVIRRTNDEGKSRSLEVDIKNLVPGDIVHLSAGDMLPGDVRLISAKELFVSQSMLSGESMPIEKDESFKPSEGMDNPFEMPNMCFMGTNVLNGTALAVIVETGNKTYFGSMSKCLTGYRPLTSFDIGINRVSWLLIQFIFAMVPLVFLINSFTKGDWLQAFLFALSVAVGLTPEMLPMIVTTNLAKGAMNMSKNKVIVKKLNSIQNFGAMDVLCTDKTGTLTEDRIILDKYLNVNGKEDSNVLFYAYLNSLYQTGLKNLLDAAVLDHKEVENEFDFPAYQKVDEIPFDFKRRKMSVIVENHGEHLLICKGAVEEVLNSCSLVYLNDSKVPYDENIKNEINKLHDELNEDGLRVLAVAYKEIKDKKREYAPKDEYELILLGLLAFLDPPKASTAQSLQLLNQYHVQIKVLTGDNELITRKICNWVDLKIDGVLNGSQVDKMDEIQLIRAVEKTTIFVKMSPLQKSRVIKALKSNNHTVGYLGDGINDAVALREADIGISVDTAVDIAKESADIIMLEKDLRFLGEGVLEGRKTFGNIMKYIKLALSSNFGNVFSVLGASLILPFLPMMPIQLLVQNLLYDFSQTTIPFDTVDEEFIVKPRMWSPKGIALFMFFIGPISSIFDYATFALMWFYFSANSLDTQGLFQSGWFVEGLLSQTLIVHMIRTQKIPFIQSIASWPLLISTAIIMAIGIYLPYSYIGKSIGLVPLPSSYFPWLFAILIAYCFLTQLVKIWFIKRFHYWL